MIRVRALVLLATLGACDRAPSVRAADGVAVVAGAARTVKADVTAFRSTAEPSVAPRAAATATLRLLSVEESARIDTPDMRSEPIRHDD